MIGSVDFIEGLYHLNLAKEKLPTVTGISASNAIIIPDQALWNFRLGHLSKSRMAMLHFDFPFIVVDTKGTCDICHLDKQRNFPYNSHNKVVKPFDLIHFDIWDALAIKSIHGYSYFLTAVDDHSRYTWLTLLKYKSEVRHHIMNFV